MALANRGVAANARAEWAGTVLLLCLLPFLSSCESVFLAQAQERFPATGQLVDVEPGRRIHLDCRGTGSPTVVLISGGDTLGALAWTPVMERSAAITRTCAFSRAGIMWSDPDPGPFSPADPARDLMAALTGSGETGPFVLAAHSRGGLYAMIFAGLYPESVSGFVFADSSHPDQDEAMKAAGLTPGPGQGLLREATLNLAWTGVLRLSPPATDPRIAAPAEAFYPRSAVANGRELRARAQILEMAGRFRDLRNWPLVVLSREPPEQTRARRELDARNAYLLPDEAAGETTPGAPLSEAVWRRLQADLATFSSRGRHEIVPESNHAFFYLKPEAVVEAIRDVVTASRLVIRQPGWADEDA
jgi:pimeloyl-ACP methyl ester carboxylesterase